MKKANHNMNQANQRNKKVQIKTVSYNFLSKITFLEDKMSINNRNNSMR